MKQNQVSEAEILFGVGWGLEYKDFTPYKVSVDSIPNEIEVAESLKVGVFGNDDFFIILSDWQIEILFCHEMDIHLRYNQENSMSGAILKHWQSKDMIQLAKTNSG